MNGSRPLVSFLCPSYNHDKYIKHFINSVLAQTIQDWELIIVDDCSTDRNIEEINKFTDGRIKLIKHEFNMGINAALNTAFDVANGEFLVFIASDDMLEPNHLEVSTKYLQENPKIGAYYCSLSHINEDGEFLNNKKAGQVNRDESRYKILNKLFFGGNCLPSPGLVFRYETFKRLYPLDIAILQFQDYKMNIDIALHNEIYLSNERLVRYRVPTINSGVSAKTPETFVREEFETNMVLDSYLKITNVDMFNKIFENEAKMYGKIAQEILPYFIGKMGLYSKDRTRKCWGYQTIMKFINSNDNFKLLNKHNGFNYKQFRETANEIEIDIRSVKSVYNSKFFKHRKVIKLYIIASAALIVALSVACLFLASKKYLVIL